MQTRIIFPLVLSVMMVGCAAPPPINFSVPDVGVSKAKIDAEVKAITVTLARPDEAKGSMPVGLEGVTNLWKESLQEAIDRMAIFKDDASKKVSIQVHILALDIPAVAGFSATKSIARYEIIDRSNGSIIYTQEISAEGAVSIAHSAIAIARTREQINRSVQNNIKQFLQALETVDINKPMFPSEVQK